MKIFAISMVKNEADIIASNLTCAAKWADKIFILDNGSTDGTWEIVQSLQSDVIIPWKQSFEPFHDGLRAEVYNEFRHLAAINDWWCFRLDADEFYRENPREFLARVPAHYGQVYKRSIDFVLTKDMLETTEFPEVFDFATHRLKHIRTTTWCELRFFRQTGNIQWPADRVRPDHLKSVYPGRINAFHFQYRSRKQIEDRLQVRLQAKREWTKDGIQWAHINSEVWQDYLAGPEEVIAFNDGLILENLPESNPPPYPGKLHELYHQVRSRLGIE